MCSSKKTPQVIKSLALQQLSHVPLETPRLTEENSDFGAAAAARLQRLQMFDNERQGMNSEGLKSLLIKVFL